MSQNFRLFQQKFTLEVYMMSKKSSWSFSRFSGWGGLFGLNIILQYCTLYISLYLEDILCGDVKVYLRVLTNIPNAFYTQCISTGTRTKYQFPRRVQSNRCPSVDLNRQFDLPKAFVYFERGRKYKIYFTTKKILHTNAPVSELTSNISTLV